MKQLLVLLFLLCSASVFAQDVIVKKDGSTIVCRVVEVSATEITYKKWSDLNGSNYVMDRSLASAINYENGKKVNLSEVDNQYRPGNQNDGVQQYNDRALLALDANIEKPMKKAKTKRLIGWIGGPTLVVLGLGAIIESGEDYGDPKGRDDADSQAALGGVLIAGGIAWTTYFLVSAHRIEKRANQLQSSSLYQYNIPLAHGSSISIGTDLIRDNTLGQNTLGLGLRYNF